MTLLIDIGNSRIKCAWSDAERVRDARDARRRPARLAGSLERMTVGYPPFERIVAVNVAGSATREAVNRWAASRAVTVRWVTACARGFGVMNGYAKPHRLGADRWAALIGARRRTTGAAWVVDCGTAITIDLLAADGRHRGGMIGPGLGVMRAGLSRAAAGIGEATDGAAGHLADDTEAAVASGTLLAAAAFVDRAVQNMPCQEHSSLTCLITGGDAERIKPLLKHEYEHVPHLVLEGLATIAANEG
jgi:type III pantothenate kinase